ncbi:MAG: lytic transglycosylase domain-containing protein [Thermoanaerobaculia bacterium]
MKRRRLVLIAAASALLMVIAILAVVLSRQRPGRHRVFREPDRAATAPTAVPPVEKWTETFAALGPEDLAELLSRIEGEQKQRYTAWSLGYLHARALIEDGELADAKAKLQPFLAPQSPFRGLAMYHASEIADAEGDHDGASRIRQELALELTKSPYRADAIDEEADYLASLPDRQRLRDFTAKVASSVDTRTRRDLNARAVEAAMRAGDTAAAVAAALDLLEGSTADDAADRVGRAIDEPAVIRVLTPEQLALLGETFQSHRHYERAAALIAAAIPRLPKRANELRFALGRSHFGNENYAEAQRIYQSSANLTKDPQWKATFLWHAARAAQLQGNDKGGEQLMTAAIAVKGNFPSTSAALTQRIRTRVKQKRFAEAGSDLALLRRVAPNGRAPVEGALALARGQLAAGNAAGALATLGSVPAARLDEFDRAEFAYWRARALEGSNLRAAFDAYLSVLRSPAPNHFAYFARERLDSPAMAAKLQQELQMREAEVTKLLAARDFTTAKRVETDRILLSSTAREAQLQRLAAIYREIPAYRKILELAPEPFPRFPVDDEGSRGTLLMAMSLFDEAADDIRDLWSLRDLQTALTQSLALNRANDSRGSIYAVEVLMRPVPDDYFPDLLPLSVRQLLYPRYFYTAITRDSERFGADPRLVLSIMREESRFNPRAKSAAAARGLLQFIITTARDIGRNIGLVDVSPEDLYDPRIIISLGAKYVATLTEEFEGNHYRAAAAYNAGPHQVKLWSRLAPATGDDFFLSAVNFDETKHYVRKVMNSYKRYGEIYDKGAPAGGVTIEP